MIEDKLKLSNQEDLKHAMFLTDLTEIELEAIVGRKNGKLLGEVVTYQSGEVVIRELKTKKVLWRI
jgi:hypothetical protein